MVLFAWLVESAKEIYFLLTFSSYVWKSPATDYPLKLKICPRDITIPGLFFANDCLLFCKANSISCVSLKSILDSFCSTSGQLINFHKSVLTFSRNASTTQKQLTIVVFNIPHNYSLDKYLGCVVFQGRPSKITFQQVISKATSKLEGWKVSCLSKALRFVMI